MSGLKSNKALSTIWSLYLVLLPTLLVWFQDFYPFPIPNQKEIMILPMIRWLIFLVLTIIALVASNIVLIVKLKKKPTGPYDNPELYRMNK